MKTETLLEARPVNPAHVDRLKNAGLSPLLAQLFAARGISTPSEAFGGLDTLLPASMMKNVAAMANYLADCVVQKKRVLIVSDYDCDGATACAVLVMAFGASGMNFDYLVPDRAIHGYGLTPAIVEEAAALEIKPDVIITVDNGISSVSGVERANELGIEVLVTDHHLAPAVLPPAKLIVNPNQEGCGFPSKDIAGCGVAWYVAKAMVQELIDRGLDPGFDPNELLSYVAIGTVADVVKLDRNNRTMVELGLRMIRQQHCAPGVLALARVAGKFHGTLSTSDIGFGIGPRINAAGRLSHMKAGIECLTTLDEREAQELSKRLDKTNEERKDIQLDIVDQAVLQVKADLTDAGHAGGDLFSILAYDAEWHEGVVGIVAGRIKEDWHRPTIVMCDSSDGDIKGSGRSIPGFHLKHALDRINIEHPGILKKFGGHAMAAGMTIDRARLGEFKEALERVCREEIAPELLIKRIRHDGELAPETFTVEDVRAMSMQVWGQGFEEPVFVNEIDVKEVKLIGEFKTHMRLTAHVKAPEGVVEEPQDIAVLGFNMAELADCVPERITIAFKPQVNNFRGESSLQMLIEHIPASLNPGLDAVLAENEIIKAEKDALRMQRMRQDRLLLSEFNGASRNEDEPAAEPVVETKGPVDLGAEQGEGAQVGDQPRATGTLAAEVNQSVNQSEQQVVVKMGKPQAAEAIQAGEKKGGDLGAKAGGRVAGASRPARAKQALGSTMAMELAAAHGVLTDSTINGELHLPGVTADLVAGRGKFVSIYGWTGDGSGRTRAALATLKAYGGSIIVHDPGEAGTASRGYWDKMFAEGLVNEMRDDLGEVIAKQMNPAPAAEKVLAPAAPSGSSAVARARARRASV